MSDRDHQPQGLAAIARQINDPRITVTSLREAIAAGRLHATRDEHGRAQVTLADARLLLSPPIELTPFDARKYLTDDEIAEARAGAEKAPLKIKKRRGQSRRRG